MALPDPGVWGIDLGQCALKAVRMKIVDGAVTATAFDYVEHPKILSQPDADPDQLTREALVKFLSRNTLRGDIVAIGVPGQSGLARFVKLPPVEEKKIGDIVRFEAKQQIPFNLDEVVWDYQKIGAGTITDGFALDTEIGLFAIKRDMVGRSLQYFKEQTVDVHMIQMAPLSLCNYIAFDLLGKGAKEDDEPELEAKKCIVALDAGSDSSNLVITDGERIIWQRPIPLGGNHFTRALTKELKLTFAKAEHLKRNATKSPDLKKILAALKPVLNDFVGEVQRSLGYFTNTHKDAQIDHMVGLGNAFRLPGLQRYLQEKLQLDVRRLSKLNRVGGDAVLNAPVFSENLATYAVALGLALQGLEKSRLVTNLLPSEIRFERIIRAKKPWAAAAAACLILATGAVALSYQMEDQAYGHPRVIDAVKNTKAVIDRVTKAQSSYDAAIADAKKEEAAVKAIVAGQAEHFNWLELAKFVGDLIPRPDASNLPAAARPAYFEQGPTRDGTHPNPGDAMSGREAWQELLKRQAGGKSVGVEKDDLGKGIDDLVQVNIEAIDCRFCDDLQTYWATVKDKLSQQLRGEGVVRPSWQWNTPPEGKQGWVVELRGYTYHYKKEYFVQDVVLETIAQLGVAPKPGGTTADIGGSNTGGGNTAATKGGPAAPPAPAPGPAPTAAAKGPAPAPAPAVVAPPSAPGQQGAAAGPPAHPVIHRVSHVVLYDVKWKLTSEGGGYEILGSSALPELVKGGGGAAPAASGPGASPAGRGPGGGGGTGGGSQSSSWTPLSKSSVSDAAGASSAGRGTLGGGARRAAADAGANKGALRGGAGSRTSDANAGAPTEGTEGQHWRTEFKVLFIWKEYTPSDELRGGAAGTP